MAIISARFYQSPNGANPVREWLLGLGEKDRKAIGFDIHTVEKGWPMGMPYCRSLGQELFEVRSNLEHGRIARTIFFLSGNEMILLHGFIKKSQKCPPYEIKLALARKKELSSWNRS